MTKEEAIKESIKVLKIAIEDSKEQNIFCFSKKGIEALDMAIKALEQTRWIPVSERLPEECISVLVWCPERKNIYCAYYKHNEWFIFGGYNHCLEEVIAWMPLPQPYKAESEDKE